MARYEVRVTKTSTVVVEAEEKAHIEQSRDRIIEALADTVVAPTMTISRSVVADDRPAQMLISVQPTLTAVEPE